MWSSPTNSMGGTRLYPEQYADLSARLDAFMALQQYAVELLAFCVFVQIVGQFFRILNVLWGGRR